MRLHSKSRLYNCLPCNRRPVVLHRTGLRRPLVQPVRAELVARGKSIPPKSIQLQRLMGEGSFGQVFEGYYTTSRGDEKVVLKRVKYKVEGAEHMGVMEHLLNVYASKVAKGYCADFLGYCQVSEDEATPRLTPGLWLMWRYEGSKTLAYYLKRRDTIRALATDLEVPEPAVVPTVMKQLFESLAAFHAAGLVHRDVKALNIIFAEDVKRFKLIDLGACADLRSGTNYVPDESILDPNYCPPEQYVLPTDSPALAKNALKLAIGPMLWARHKPDRFDTWSAGIAMLQLALPSMRLDRGLRQFNATFGPRYDYDLKAWREGSRIPARDCVLLDADEGAGWDLLQALLRPRAIATDDNGGVYFTEGRAAPRISAAEALRHRFMKQAMVPGATEDEDEMVSISGSRTAAIPVPVPVLASGGSTASKPQASGFWRGFQNKLFDLEARMKTVTSATEVQLRSVKKLRQEVAAGRADPEELRRQEQRLGRMGHELQEVAEEVEVTIRKAPGGFFTGLFNLGGGGSRSQNKAQGSGEAVLTAAAAATSQGSTGGRAARQAGTGGRSGRGSTGSTGSSGGSTGSSGGSTGSREQSLGRSEDANKEGLWAQLTSRLAGLERKRGAQASATSRQVANVKNLKAQVAAGQLDPRELERQERKLTKMEQALLRLEQEKAEAQQQASGLLGLLNWATSRGGSGKEKAGGGSSSEKAGGSTGEKAGSSGRRAGSTGRQVDGSSSRGGSRSGSRAVLEDDDEGSTVQVERRPGLWDQLSQGLARLRAKKSVQTKQISVQSEAVEKLKSEVAAGRADPVQLDKAQRKLTKMQQALQRLEQQEQEASSSNLAGRPARGRPAGRWSTGGTTSSSDLDDKDDAAPHSSTSSRSSSPGRGGIWGSLFRPSTGGPSPAGTSTDTAASSRDGTISSAGTSGTTSSSSAGTGTATSAAAGTTSIETGALAANLVNTTQHLGSNAGSLLQGGLLLTAKLAAGVAAGIKAEADKQRQELKAREEAKKREKANSEAFMTMLRQCGPLITSATTYEDLREVAGTDSRFLAIDEGRRRMLLSSHTATLVQAENNAKMQAEEALRALYRQTITSWETPWEDMIWQLGNNEVFLAVSMPERKQVFGGVIAELTAKRDAAEAAKRAEADFMELLQEVDDPPLLPTTTWQSCKLQIWRDGRYMRVPERRRRELYEQFLNTVVTPAAAEAEARAAAAAEAAAVAPVARPTVPAAAAVAAAVEEAIVAPPTEQQQQPEEVVAAQQAAEVAAAQQEVAAPAPVTLVQAAPAEPPAAAGPGLDVLEQLRREQARLLEEYRKMEAKLKEMEAVLMQQDVQQGGQQAVQQQQGVQQVQVTGHDGPSTSSLEQQQEQEQQHQVIAQEESSTSATEQEQQEHVQQEQQRQQWEQQEELQEQYLLQQELQQRLQHSAASLEHSLDMSDHTVGRNSLDYLDSLPTAATAEYDKDGSLVFKFGTEER